MIGPLAQIIRTANLFKTFLRYFCKVSRKLNFCILWFDWLIDLYIFTPLPYNTSFIIVKHGCVREELSDVVFFLQTQLQKITVQEHIFGEFSLAPFSFGSCTSPTDTLPSTYHYFNDSFMCAVYDFQRLIFDNSQPPKNLTGNPKTKNQRLHCKPYTPSTRSMEQPNIYPDSENIPLGRLFLPRDMLTHIRPSFLTTNHPLKTLQQHLSLFQSRTYPPKNSSNIFWPTHLSRAKLTYS